MPTGNPTLPKEVTTSPTASESQLENQMSPRILLEKGLPPDQVRWCGTEEHQSVREESILQAAEPCQTTGHAKSQHIKASRSSLSDCGTTYHWLNSVRLIYPTVNQKQY